MPDLLHTLAAVALLLLAATGGALGRRIDGGLLAMWAGRDMGKFGPRAIAGALVALPLAGALWLTGGPLHTAASVAVAVWLASTAGLHGAENMGRDTTSPAHPIIRREWWADAAGAAFYGVASTAATGFVLWFAVGWWSLLALPAGLLCAACYELAWRRPLHIPPLGCFRYDPPPTGELLFGAVRGLLPTALVLGVL